MVERKRLRIPVLVFSLVIALCFFISPTRGIGVSPSHIDLGEVYRGDSSISYLLVSSNYFETVNIIVDGFLKDYIEVNETSFNVYPGKAKRVKLKLNGLKSVRNGVYNGSLMIYGYRPVSLGNGKFSTIMEAVRIPITVNITGEQIVSCRLLNLYVYRSCENELRVGLVVENNGTVSINPRFNYVVTNGSKTFMDGSSMTETILPKEVKLIMLNLEGSNVYGRFILNGWLDECSGYNSLVFFNAPVCEEKIRIKDVVIEKTHNNYLVNVSIVNKEKYNKRIIVSITGSDNDSIMFRKDKELVINSGVTDTYFEVSKKVSNIEVRLIDAVSNKIIYEYNKPILKKDDGIIKRIIDWVRSWL